MNSEVTGPFSRISLNLLLTNPLTSIINFNSYNNYDYYLVLDEQISGAPLKKTKVIIII